MKKNFKILILFLILILFGTSLSFAKTKNKDGMNSNYDDKYYYTQAVQYLQSGNILQAQEYLGRALKINPKNPETLYMEANIELRYGRYQDALNHYNLAIKYTKEKNYSYYLQRSLCNIELKNYKDALKDLLLMREMSTNGPLNTDDSLLYLICGIVEAKSVGEDIALPIQKNVQKDGGVIVSYTKNYSISTLTKKEYEIINKNLTEGIKNYPNNPIFYTLRGICATKANRKDLALIDFNKAVEVNPIFYPAIIERANIYFQSSQFPLSLRDYQMINAVMPNNSYILWRIGENYLELGEHNKARSYFNLSIQKAKKDEYTSDIMELYMATIKRMVAVQTKEKEYVDIISNLNQIIREYNNSHH